MRTHFFGIQTLNNHKNTSIMKKAIEFIMWVFFGIFFMGVLVMLCGEAEFDRFLIQLGGVCTVMGFLLTVTMLVVWDYSEKRHERRAKRC